MSVLATETLIQIFEYLDSNSDLLHAIRACKVFYDIGIAQLYRHIHYNSHQEFGAHDTFCLNQRDAMRRIPRSIGLTGVIYPTDPNSADEDDRRRGRFQADMWIRILSFTSLHTLCFKICGLPDMQSFSYLLQGCRSLRKLVIDECTFYEEPLDCSEGYGIFPQLPITDLSLLGRIAVHSSTQSGGSDPSPFHHFLTMTSLRTLAIDVVKDLDRVLAGHAPHKSNLSSLCKLKTLRLCLRPSFLRKATQEELATFLNEKCHSIQELEVTRFHENKNLRLFPRALRNLTSYKGSSNFLIPLRDAGSSLKRLDISNSPMLLVDALGLLEKVAARWPNLESLDITIKEWDAEILYAISHLFRDFREVKIKYEIGHLNESSILSMASSRDSTCRDAVDEAWAGLIGDRRSMQPDGRLD
ncbi:uncharacterized protein ARMOST_18517 [Armillaria ostoyae]|uniref:F-box domain-containing protein n=1 Tax=Armillaria ostoyae TaxID=47428 RepID=A0A284S200_ARMOS|nr:uncharacterized protein ARMOST_18517 [Armillaria ostoyae]